jgi:CheY-like chemotaxis protein
MAPRPARAYDLAMARILVLDDDRDILRIIQLRLEKNGHVVVGVDSPQKALELVLAGELPDVVVLDISMPEISGLEVLQTLRVGFGLEKLPAIFLSARVKPEEIEAGEALGATYLTKPFVATALFKAIDNALGIRPKP